MTIDEAIKICEDDAEKIGGNPQSDRHAERCRQLAEWLMELKDLRAEQNEQYVFIRELMDELKEAKRLLKEAVEDMNSNNICFDINACNVCTEKNCISCDTFHWRYTDEVKRLLRGGDTNG